MIEDRVRQILALGYSRTAAVSILDSFPETLLERIDNAETHIEKRRIIASELADKKAEVDETEDE